MLHDTQSEMDKKSKQWTADLSSPEDMSIDDHVALHIEDSTDDESMSQNDTSHSDVQMSVVDDDCHWKGKSIQELQRGFGNGGPHPLPNVSPSKNHTVLIKLPVKQGQVPSHFPTHQQDKWDPDHVRMPFSSHSLYPVTQENGETSLRPRWELINEALLKTITNSKHIEAAIFSYNSRYNEKWDFKALHTFFNEVLEEEEVEIVFETIFPRIVQLALQLPDLVTGPLPLLRRDRAHAITLSQLQIASLLANAFLCTFPRRNTTKRNSEYASYPDINFNRLFQCGSADSSSYIMEKFRCIFNYFRRVTTQAPTGVVTFARRSMRPGTLPQWSRSSNTLPALHVTSTGTIENEGTGMLQVNFANKFVGGGVLGWGCVQEEIRCLICPELLISRLFTEALEPTEALLIIGCEQYNAYSGYSDSFLWAGNYNDSTPRDPFGRKQTAIVAIDALMFTHSKEQYSVKCISRELNKAYVGFHDPDWSIDPSRRNIPLTAVATGNWGCGAFRGDAELKALLQLMAAAEAKRPLAYFTFNNKQLRDEIYDVYKYLTDRCVTVGRLWQVLCRYCKELESNMQSRPGLYQYLYQIVDTPSPNSSEISRNQQPTVCKQPTENRSPIIRSEQEQSILAEAGYSAEFLDAIMENISSEENSIANSQKRNSEGNSNEEINLSSNEEFSDKECKGRTLSEYFVPKPSSSRNDSIRDTLDNSTSSRNPIDNLTSSRNSVDNSTSPRNSVDNSTSSKNSVDNSTSSKNSVDNLSSSRKSADNSTSCRNSVDNPTSSRNSVFSLLEAEERVGVNSPTKKRTDLDPEQLPLDEVSESALEEIVDQNAKRPKRPEPPSRTRKISDYFGIVQS